MVFSFGLVSQIDADVGLGSFILMIAFLVFFEHVTSVLEWSLEGVPIYNHMLQKIYKEVMMMGVVSFAIGMYLTTDEAHQSGSQKWIIGVDFAHYILFYMAFFFVMHVFYLIFLAMRYAKEYDRCNSMSIQNVQNLMPSDSSLFSKLMFKYSPVSRTREVFEFKVIHVLFRNTYSWVTLNFDFGLYLTGCMQQYALRVMSAGSFSWLIILVLIVLNYARIKLGGSEYLNCGDDKFVTPSHHFNSSDYGHHEARLLAASAESHHVSHQCNRRALRMYFLCGFVLCVVTITFLIACRIYIMRLIRHTGCETTDEYSEFLSLEEVTLAEEKKLESNQKSSESTNHHQPSVLETDTFVVPEVKPRPRPSSTGAKRSRRMSVGTAARSINELKKNVVSEEEECYRHVSALFSSCRAWLLRSWDRALEFIEDSWMYVFRRSHYHRMMERRRALTQRQSPPAEDGSTCSSSDTAAMQRARIRSLRSPNPESPAPEERPSIPRRSTVQPRNSINTLTTPENFNNTITKFKMKKMASGRLDSNSTGSKRSAVAPHGNAPNESPSSGVKSSQDFSDIYLFQSPKLFFTSIEVLFALNCFYLAMWVTNFITIVETSTEYSLYWEILMLFPVVLIMPCLGQIVKTASLLSAIADLDLNVMASVFESIQDKNNLLKILKERIEERINDVERSAKIVISNLFDEIDTDGSGELSKREFSILFQLLELNYSDEKFNRLFKAIDANRDSSISKDEFYKMVFPELQMEDASKSASALNHLEEGLGNVRKHDEVTKFDIDKPHAREFDKRDRSVFFVDNDGSMDNRLSDNNDRAATKKPIHPQIDSSSDESDDNIKQAYSIRSPNPTYPVEDDRRLSIDDDVQVL